MLIGFWLLIAPFYWLMRLLAFVVDRVQGRRNSRLARSPVGWALEPLLLVVTVWLCQSDLPLLLRFRASEPALVRLVRKANAGQRQVGGPAWAGLYLILVIETLPGGTIRMKTDDGL